MSNYRRGRDLEYRVKDYLASNGYWCVRAASSKGIAERWMPYMGEVCGRMRSGRNGAGNTASTLTRSSDLTREGLAMNATHVTRTPRSRGRAQLCRCGCGIRTSAKGVEFVRGHRLPLSPKNRVRRIVSVDLATHCWNSTKVPDGNGYVTLGFPDGKRMAHRVSYEAFVGPVPDGLVIDHLCRNRRCLNPDHMEPVTQGENARRGGGLEIANESRRGGRFVGRCKRGHDRATHQRVAKDGKSFCSQCGREASLRWWRENRQGDS